jgi:hypothetical protein
MTVEFDPPFRRYFVVWISAGRVREATYRANMNSEAIAAIKGDRVGLAWCWDEDSFVFSHLIVNEKPGHSTVAHRPFPATAALKLLTGEELVNVQTEAEDWRKRRRRDRLIEELREMVKK